MKYNVHTLEDLRREIDRLTVEKALKERQLSHRARAISEKLKPINLVKSAFASLSGDSELKSTIASKGTEAALGFIVTNLIFKNSNPFVRTAATILGTSFASKILGEDSSKYIEKIKSLYQKFKSHRKKEPDESFNEEDLY